MLELKLSKLKLSKLKMPNFLNGNIQLLRSGEEYFPALIIAIENAVNSIYLQTYIYEVDQAGINVGNALKQAAQRGVAVNLLLDGFGSKDLPKAYLNILENAGVQVMFYRPKISPWTLKKNRLRRLHRKIAVIDESIAFVGGINIIDDYNVPDNTPPRIDYAVQIEGALLPSIAANVVKLWHRLQWMRDLTSQINVAARINLQRPFKQSPQPNKTPQVEAIQQVTVTPQTKSQTESQTKLAQPAKLNMQAAFVLRDNLLHRNDIEDAYLSAINAAKSEIIIANAYFVPGRDFRKALLKAAQRGVKIELLLQGRMEYFLMFATHAFYSVFLKNGVQIFEYRKSYMHCKVAVIDGYWSTVGSTNIDPFSMMLAHEANIIVQDKAFADELRTDILSTIREGAFKISAHDWQHGNKLKRFFSWLVYGLVRLCMGLIGYSNER